MAGYDGTIKFDTAVDQKGFSSGMDSLLTTAKKGAAALGIAFSATAIVKGVYDVASASISLASNLQEVQNVVDVTFGDGADKVNKWASTAASAYGLSELAAKEAAGSFGAMFKAMGLGSEVVNEMSTEMAGLVGDFSSFYNVEQDAAATILRSAISGETESIKRYGVNMGVAALEAYALASGVGKSYEEMTIGEKAILRQNYLMKSLQDVQGDYVRTSDGFANSQRTMKLNIESVGTAIGNILLPSAAKGAQAVGDLAEQMAAGIDKRGIIGGIDALADAAPVATAAVTGLAASFGALLVVKVVTGAMAGYTAVQASLTALTVAGTVTEWAEIGALSAKQIVVGFLTKQLSATTAAQALWNATVMANPVMLLVAAIGLLVGALVLIDKNFDQINPKMALYTSAVKNASDQTDALSRSVEQSAQSYAETTAAIEKEAAASNALVDDLYALSAGYTGSTIEQERMQAICDELNASIPGLSIAYNENTGQINLNAQAVRDLISAKQEEARRNADIERSITLTKEESDAKYNLWTAQKAYNDLLDTGVSSTSAAARFAAKSLREAQEGYDAAGLAVSDYNAYLEETGALTEDTAAKTEDAAAAAAALAEEQERVVIGGYDVTDVLTATGVSAEEATDRLNLYTDAATNMFEKINTKSDVNVKQMIGNLEANTDALNQWAENVAALGGKLPDDLLQPLIDQGPDKMAGVLETLANSSDADLSALTDAFTTGGQAAKDAWLASLGADDSYTENNPAAKTAEAIAADTTLPEAATTAAVTVVETMATAIAEADYSAFSTNLKAGIEPEFKKLYPVAYEAGRYMSMGFIIGMLSRRAEIISDARGLGMAALNAFNSALRNMSPSKATQESAKFFVLGFTNQIKRGIQDVRKSTTELAQGALGGFTTTLDVQKGSYDQPGKDALQATLSAGKTVPAYVGAGDVKVKVAPAQPIYIDRGIEKYEPHYHVPVESPAQQNRRLIRDMEESNYASRV